MDYLQFMNSKTLFKVRGAPGAEQQQPLTSRGTLWLAVSA